MRPLRGTLLIAPSPVLDRLERLGTDYVCGFRAMATPCEVRIECADFELARQVGESVQCEALRIEEKFSRYKSTSVIGRINGSSGASLRVDDETSRLLDCAQNCYEVSSGLFDVTSGILRRAWSFDGSDRIPAAQIIRALLPLIGWQRVTWCAPEIVLPAGMEIDLGGIAKEYAVDMALSEALKISRAPVLVNFGGDLRVSGPRLDGSAWNVAIEAVDSAGQMAGMLHLRAGALATSGDARRFLLHNGKRYSHILNPRTGWPVRGAPRSVTVAAQTCVEAGILSTLAMLKGRHAERFLKNEDVRAWCIR